MKFNDKNIIVGFSNHIFVNLYINTLVSKCGIDKSDICFVTLDDTTESESSRIGIETYNHTDCPLDEFTSCKTITFMSLGIFNSFLIRKIFEHSAKMIEKTFIHLTDDEVARWVKVKNKTGKLIVNKRSNIDADCIYVIDNAINYIAPNEPFHSSLKFVLGRDNFKLFDGRDAFKTMPTELWDKFTTLYQGDKEHSKPEDRILIGAKRGAFSLLDTISILQNLQAEGVLPKYKCMVFIDKKHKSHRVCIDLYLAYLKHIKKCDVDISFPTPVNNITYNALIMSCSHLILQGRGSMTTARCFISQGRGIVHVLSDSPNEIELTRSEGVKVASFNNFKKLAGNIKNNSINISHNQEKISNSYTLKYEVLSHIYK